MITDERQGGAGVEVTDEMIEAGARGIMKYDSRFDGHTISSGENHTQESADFGGKR